MKLIQLIGTRKKSTSAIYIAHVIGSMGKRVLLVDATNDDEYLFSYIRSNDGEFLYELQNIEILIQAKDWKEVNEKLNVSNEALENFDCIIVDTNDERSLLKDWPKFDHTLYFSDNNRFNILNDVELLNTYMDVSESVKVKRIHFESAYKLPPGYIELLLNNRIEFANVTDPIEFDEMEEKLQLIIQHDYEIPFNRLTKSYKNAITDIITEWFGIGNVDVQEALKRNPLGMLFKGFKQKHQQEPNRENNTISQKPKTVDKKENHSTKEHVIGG